MELFELGAPVDDHDLESAKLKLALLKENFDFQMFYEDLVQYKGSTYQLEKKPPEMPPAEFIEMKQQQQAELSQIHLIAHIGNTYPSLQNYCDSLGFHPEIISFFVIDGKISFSEILTLLNPRKDLTEVQSQAVIGKALPQMFRSPGVRELTATGIVLTRWFREGKRGLHQLQPYERLYLVDLRKRKTQLITELEIHK